MYGSNDIMLNELTMKEIVQYYFDNKMFAKDQAPNVVGVVNDNTAPYSFQIKCEKSKDAKEPSQ